MKLYIDADAIAEQVGQFQEAVKQDVKTEVGRLASTAHQQVLTMAASELKSSQKLFRDNCKFREVMDGVWVVEILKPALWIEEGIKEGYDMKDGLLKNAETVNGKKMKVIPFDHNKPPSQLTPFAQDVVSRIRNQLKKDKINFKKIEMNKDGSPRIGKLHTLDYGGEAPGKGNTPVMQGISIYQTAKNGAVRRDILTFRTVTDAPNQKNKWKHPGYEGKKFLDKAHEMALEMWEKEILPAILDKWK